MMSEISLMSPDTFNNLPTYKKVFLSLETQFDIDVSIANLQLDYLIEKTHIEQKEAELKILVEDGNSDLLDKLYMEADNGSKEGIVNALRKICDSIIRFFKNTADMIREKIQKVFSKFSAKKLSADDYMNSNTVNMELNIHYEQTLKSLETQMSLGEKLLHKAGSAIGINDDEIDKFVLKTEGVLKSIPNIVCKAATGAAVAGGIIILSKNYSKIANSLLSKVDSMEKRVEDTKKSITGLSPDKERKILNTQSKICKAYNTITSRINLGMAALAMKTTAIVDDSRGKDISSNQHVRDKLKNIATSIPGLSKEDIAAANAYSKKGEYQRTATALSNYENQPDRENAIRNARNKRR